MAYKHRSIKLEKSKDTLNLTDYNQLLEKRRGYTASSFKKNETIVLLLSGGLDSIGLWVYLLMKEKIHVFPIYFYRNNLNTAPYKAIQYFEKLLQARFPTNFEPVKVQKIANPLFILTRLKRDFSAKLDLSTMLHNLSYDPSNKKYVPLLPNQLSRLGIFVFTAFDYALSISFKHNIEVNKIVYGLMPEEDILRGSELPLIRLFSLTLCELTRNNHWEILAPIDKQNGFYLTKRKLVSYCAHLNISLDRTWSCGRSNQYHCGTCFNCYSRKKAFHDAGREDKTIYRISKLNIILSNLYQHWNEFKYKLTKKSDQPRVKYNFSLTGKIKINPKLQWLHESNKLFILNEDDGCIEEIQGRVVEIWESLVKTPQSPNKIIENGYFDRKKIISFLRQALKNNYVIYE